MLSDHSPDHCLTRINDLQPLTWPELSDGYLALSLSLSLSLLPLDVDNMSGYLFSAEQEDEEML